MPNPLLSRYDKRLHGTKSERRIAKNIGARRNAGSGAIEGLKGDSSLANLLIESKATVNGSLSLKKEWLDKITREALAQNKNPALTISFVTGSGESLPGGDFLVIPLWLAKTLGLVQ